MDKLPFDLAELERLVEAGEVAKRPHPTKDLFIYSYLKTWYPEWTDTLRWARGLVLNSKGKVIACPFKKFFNYSEIRSEIDELIANGVKHQIQEKLDGSLGILFCYEGEWILSTKGSFISDQAVKGMQILKNRYPEYVGLDPDYTYLFEIIYPENQIVVKYEEENLILLATMNPKTFKEVPVPTYHVLEADRYGDAFMSLQQVRQYDLKISDVIKDMSRPDYCSSEGFVVVFENGTRVKFKYDEYVKLHKIVSDFKPKHIVELMKSGVNVEEFIASLPDEFHPELIEVADATNQKYIEICVEAIRIFDSIYSDDKKTFALEAVKHDIKAILFDMWKHCQKQKDIVRVQWMMNIPSINEMIYDKILAGLE